MPVTKQINRHNAFTLMEMLIVITIISLLASIMAVKYTQIQENGWATACKGNLRALFMATQASAHDQSAANASGNTGHYPSVLSIIWVVYSLVMGCFWMGILSWLPDTTRRDKKEPHARRMFRSFLIPCSMEQRSQCQLV